MSKVSENFENELKDGGKKTKRETSKTKREEKHEVVEEDSISAEEIPMSNNMVKAPPLKKK